MDKVTVIGYFEHITNEGDTFDILAFQNYNDEQKAHYIIEANLAYANTLVFEQGIPLSIPILDVMEVPESLPPWRR